MTNYTALLNALDDRQEDERKAFIDTSLLHKNESPGSSSESFSNNSTNNNTTGKALPNIIPNRTRVNQYQQPPQQQQFNRQQHHQYPCNPTSPTDQAIVTSFAQSATSKPWQRPIAQSITSGGSGSGSNGILQQGMIAGAGAGGGGIYGTNYDKVSSKSSTILSSDFKITSHANALETDPGRWHTNEKEPDDDLHDPRIKSRGDSISCRGCLNVGTLLVLAFGILCLFLGYPMLYEFFIRRKEGTKGGYGMGGTNLTGQVPDFSTLQFVRTGLIDHDTPKSVYKKSGFGPNGDETWNLMFSDEFNIDGRSFYPGNDPFWEAVDLYAHGTGDLEWYDPSAVTTKDGALEITIIPAELHNLHYRSGQVTSWNQFCLTGGYLEAAVVLPGSPAVSGWWPAIWMMGNLGRANYGATTEGTWPYSYNSCDRGTLINQTDWNGLGPISAITGGNVGFNGQYKTTMLSWQPGQRLSACTCPDEDHPGPRNTDGSYVGRSSPELDLFEAQVWGGQGSLSQSCQFMPASDHYKLINTTGTEYSLFTSNGDPVNINSFTGSVLQMAASAVAHTNQEAYELADATYGVWGVEYEPGPKGYATWWVNGQKTWTLTAAAVGADVLAGISQRPIPEEPMYIIMNLALSQAFGNINWNQIQFPAKMKVDYIRVYQEKSKQNIGCDPPNRPTYQYIKRHWEAYTNPNFTIWGGTREIGGYGAFWPRNRLYNDGKGCDEEPRNYPGRLRPQGYEQSPFSTVPVQYRGTKGGPTPDDPTAGTGTGTGTDDGTTAPVPATKPPPTAAPVTPAPDPTGTTAGGAGGGGGLGGLTGLGGLGTTPGTTPGTTGTTGKTGKTKTGTTGGGGGDGDGDTPTGDNGDTGDTGDTGNGDNNDNN